MSGSHPPHARSPHKGDGRIHVARNLYLVAFHRIRDKQRVWSDGSGKHGGGGPSKVIDEDIEAKVAVMGDL